MRNINGLPYWVDCLRFINKLFFTLSLQDLVKGLFLEAFMAVLQLSRTIASFYKRNTKNQTNMMILSNPFQTPWLSKFLIFCSSISRINSTFQSMLGVGPSQARAETLWARAWIFQIFSSFSHLNNYSGPLPIGGLEPRFLKPSRARAKTFWARAKPQAYLSLDLTHPYTVH